MGLQKGNKQGDVVPELFQKFQKFILVKKLFWNLTSHYFSIFFLSRYFQNPNNGPGISPFVCATATMPPAILKMIEKNFIGRYTKVFIFLSFNIYSFNFFLQKVNSVWKIWIPTIAFYVEKKKFNF